MADSKTVVLVADDEPSTLAMVSAHLRGRGFRVLEATDGDQAWELAHEHLPHLVVLDVMMPGMSGWEVCKKIREAVSLAHAGVIMLTGIGDTLNEMTSPLYGADAYVDKPFEFADLDRKIDETLSRRREGALGRADFDDDNESTGPTSTGPGLAKAKRPKRSVRLKKAAATQTELAFVSVLSASTPEKQEKPAAKMPKSEPQLAKKSASSAKAKPAKPVVEKPVAKAKGAAKAAKSGAKAKPAAKVAKPVAKPAAKVAKPVAKPAAKVAKPAAKAAKPAAKAAKPVAKTKPAAKAKLASKGPKKPVAKRGAAKAPTKAAKPTKKSGKKSSKRG